MKGCPAIIRYLYDYLWEMILSVFLALICLTVLTGVVSRYAFNQPVTWSEEIARYLFIWISFVGAAVAVKHKANFGLDLVSGRLSARGRWLLGLAGDVLVAAFGLALLCFGWQMLPLVRMGRGSAIDISMGWVFLAIPVGGFLIIWYSLVHFWTFRRRPSAEPDYYPDRTSS